MANSENDDLPKWFREHVPPDLARSSLFRFVVKLSNGNVCNVNLTEDIDINFEILEDQHERIPAQYVYWASMYSELRSAVAIMDLKIRSRRHSILRRIIDEFKTRGIKPTDKQTVGIVDGDKELIRLEAEQAILQKNCGKVYHMVEAIRLRSEHSRSLAGFKRQEKEQSSRLT